MKKVRKRGRRNTGALSITLIVVAFIAVMGVQIYRMKQKDADYAAQEQELMQEYEEETQRATELEELEAYMKSSEYIEDVAKSKLGLTYENEIIFKESEAD